MTRQERALTKVFHMLKLSWTHYWRVIQWDEAERNKLDGSRCENVTDYYCGSSFQLHNDSNNREAQRKMSDIKSLYDSPAGLD